MIFAGIDPGVTGALVFLSETSRVLYGEPLPTQPYRKSRYQIACGELARRLSPLREPNIESLITIEDVHAFPGQGVSSTFSFGMTFGQVLGVIESLGLRYQIVSPQTWQKPFFGSGSGNPKNRSKVVAQRLWPACRDLSGGMIDALLIAEYGRRSWHGKTP